MAHNIDMTHGRANVAYLGSRDDVWHRLGQEMTSGMTLEQWAEAAGLNWEAVKVPAIADLSASPYFAGKSVSEQLKRVQNRSFLVRSDNAHPLGYVSGDEGEGYRQVQPLAVLKWFDRYIEVDDRFEIDTAGSLKNGEIIWAMAKYKGDVTVAGDKHKARLLMTTTFDGSGATTNKASMTRVICNNTLDAAMYDGKALVRTLHNTTFKPEQVARELGKIVASFAKYKAMGEAMVNAQMSKDQISLFFKQLLEIPFDAKPADISGKKMSAFNDLRDAYSNTVREGTQPGTKWSALNAVTRYADHDRSVRANGRDADEARVLSSQFGSGARLKAQAVQLLVKGDEILESAIAASAQVANSGSRSLLDDVLANTPR